MAGACVDGEGRPLSQVWLYVAGISGHSGLTDEGGRFDLGYLPPGAYEVIGGAEGRGFCHFPVEHGGGGEPQRLAAANTDGAWSRTGSRTAAK